MDRYPWNWRGFNPQPTHHPNLGLQFPQTRGGRPVPPRIPFPLFNHPPRSLHPQNLFPPPPQSLLGFPNPMRGYLPQTHPTPLFHPSSSSSNTPALVHQLTHTLWAHTHTRPPIIHPPQPQPQIPPPSTNTVIIPPLVQLSFSSNVQTNNTHTTNITTTTSASASASTADAGPNSLQFTKSQSNWQPTTTTSRGSTAVQSNQRHRDVGRSHGNKRPMTARDRNPVNYSSKTSQYRNTASNSPPIRKDRHGNRVRSLRETKNHRQQSTTEDVSTSSKRTRQSSPALRERVTTTTTSRNQSTVGSITTTTSHDDDLLNPDDEEEDDEDETVVEENEITQTLSLRLDPDNQPRWIRCTPADLYYSADPSHQKNGSTTVVTNQLMELHKKFEQFLNIYKDGDRDIREQVLSHSKQQQQQQQESVKTTTHGDQSSSDDDGSANSDSDSSTSSSSASADSESRSANNSDDAHSDFESFLTKLNKAPAVELESFRLHRELYFNKEGRIHHGKPCSCGLPSGAKQRLYPGEKSAPRCDPHTNNAGQLSHYRLTITPDTNFLTENPTVIKYDAHEYIFEGFSLYTHVPIDHVPVCRFVRFNIEYTIHVKPEPFPPNFCIKDLNIFNDYMFKTVLELVEWGVESSQRDDECEKFHFMPRFIRILPDSGLELLSMHQVLSYLIKQHVPVVKPSDEHYLKTCSHLEWTEFVTALRPTIVTYPNKKPRAVRVDQVVREKTPESEDLKLLIIHFGNRPPQQSYRNHPRYRKMWRSYVKLRHLLANRPKVTMEDRRKLQQIESALSAMRKSLNLKLEVTIELDVAGAYRTGIRSDICQHSLILPIISHHIRYHNCLRDLDVILGYTFTDRYLLQLALTHPSYQMHIGFNPEHVRNIQDNCGQRHLAYGDRTASQSVIRRKGINVLVNVMLRLNYNDVDSNDVMINHNERLEFLGDAVIELVTSHHLFFLFPNMDEGGLTAYRTAVVQNQHLALLAKRIQLQKFMLYGHSAELCQETYFNHAMANCFEALMGALYLEGGLQATHKVFGDILFEEIDLRDVWANHPQHPLQEQEPSGDRHMINSSPVLQKLLQFEDMTGIEFTHIRLLARAFSHKAVGTNKLTLGHNQRLEFLGDTVMELLTSEYLYSHFPGHHEGHLSLLRSSLVNNKVQAEVAGEIGMEKYVISPEYWKGSLPELQEKAMADLLEAFFGALYVDKGLEYVHVFCKVCFYPKLQNFIMMMEWNDPKSRLQQCCLTLRQENKDPDVPVYKIRDRMGPAHGRKYTAVVYFRGKRIGVGYGNSIQKAEMYAASNALTNNAFPQLRFQERLLKKAVEQVQRSQEVNDDSESEQSATEMVARWKQISQLEQ